MLGDNRVVPSNAMRSVVELPGATFETQFAPEDQLLLTVLPPSHVSNVAVAGVM
jgi:hypothetical protein